MVYSYKTYGYSVPAETVGKYFEKLEKKHGELTAQLVLDSARPEKSPIHSIFEWDDTKAAEKYRLQQATRLICNLVVEVETKDEPIVCRAYMDVAEAKVGSFINTKSAFENKDTREIVLKRALDELNAFKQKYMNLKELATIIKDIDELLEKGGR